MLSLFKGELSYNDIMFGMSRKHMMALRDARVRALIREQEEMEKERKKAEQERARNQILAK